VLRHEPGEVGGSAERAAVDLGEAEDGVVRVGFRPAKFWMKKG
jgi:hypothetical protein